MTDPNEVLAARGVALGHSDIRSDTMTFRFRGETFTFPTRKAKEIAVYNGFFYEARIEDLRRLESEAATG